MTRPGIEPRSPGPLANTLTIMPKSGYLFIIYLNYILRTSVDPIKENSFTLKTRNRRYPTKTMSDADYADDLGIPTTFQEQEALLST